MMKKMTLAALLLAVCSVPALAAQQGGFVSPEGAQATQGGFSGPSAALTTVEKAKTLRDDAWVILQGNIEQRLGDDTYLFRDSTGTINVDISHKRWGGQTITPTDKVQIEGEVDKDWNSVEIDVKSISKIN